MSTGNTRNPDANDSLDASGAPDKKPDDMTLADGGDTAPTNPAATDEWVGKTIGKYNIVGLLGRGGMGAVYRAHDESLSRDVALKLLPEHLAADSVLRDRFLSEAKSAAQISHPNVVPIFDVGQEGNTYFIAMELIPGGNSEQTAPPGGAYPPRQATRMIADACRGLVAAHKTGLIHRDVKPSNLLRMSDGSVKLADFGLAKGNLDRPQALTQTGQIMGTPYYMSPEQCQSKPIDHRTDIYSLGATYFSLLTGRRPYADIQSDIQVMYAHCHGDELDPCAIDAGVPAECGRVVIRATAKRPEDRYQSAAEMLADLESVQRQLEDATDIDATVIADANRFASPGSTTKRRTVLIAAVGAVLLGAVLGGALWLRQGAGTDEADGQNAVAAAGPLFRGVTQNSITFGTTTAYSGANQDLGRNMVLGMRTCFDAVNDAGGINGRMLKLVVLDDGYEPTRALANMHELFEQRHVFGVIGNVGTPTAKVTAPYAIEHRDLFFAPFTGASFLRTNPPERYIFNYRAGYSDETAALVKYFVEIKEIPADRIAVFAQNDSYGDDGFRGVQDALRKYGVRPEDVLRVNYERNSVQVSDAVTALASHEDQIRAVVMVATYKPAARFVREMKDRGGEMMFAALSFVGSEALSEEFREVGAEHAEGVIVSQVVPFYHSSATGVIRYRDALAKYHPETHPGFVSLEGFIAAECLVAGLKRVEGELTTESLIDALDSIRDLDLGIGPIISFGPSKHQASHRVWGTILDASAEYQTLDLERP